MLGGLPLIFGVCIAAAPVEMVISRLLRYTQKVITPLVSGIVVTLIGMSLIKVGIIACGGGTAAREAGTFGNPGYLGLAALVLALIVLFNRSRNRYLRMSSIFIGLGTGYLIAWWAGMIDFASVQHYGGINLPVPFKYGLAFDLSSFIAIALIFVITAIEAYGDITANSLISGEPVKGERFIKRASGGILADGMNSMLAGIFNSFPNSVFAQNNGIIQLTGVASRYVGYYIAGMLMILGLFPAIGLVFSLIPRTRAGRRDPADVRHRRCGRHPDHRLPTHRPQRGTRHSTEPLVRAERRTGAGSPRQNVNHGTQYFFFGYHHGRPDGYPVEPANPHQGDLTL